MDSISPVWTDDEVPIEKVIALDQQEYIPLVALPIQYSDGSRAMAVRFRLDAKERKAIAEGADIVVTELTGGHQFTPISIQVCFPNTIPV